MNYSVFRFTLNMHNHRSQASVPVFVDDTGIRLLISLTDGGNPYFIEDGCTAMFRGKKADGNPIFNKCLILNNTTIQYDFTRETSNCEGIVTCEIDLYGADGTLITAPKFIIVVDSRSTSDADIDEAISVAEVNIIPTLIATMESEQGRVEAEAERREKEDERQAEEVKRLALYENMTTLYNGASDLDARISKNDKRITNLEKGLMPDSYETDSDVAYIKNVPENALPYAAISKIGGMTYREEGILKDAKVTEVNSVSDPYRVPEAVQSLDGYGMGIDSTHYNYVDLENEELIRKVKKITFDGTEADWKMEVTGSGQNFYYDIALDGAVQNSTVLCNRFGSTGTAAVIRNNCWVTRKVNITADGYDTLEAWKSQLAIWNAEGNPLTVVYRLGNAETVDISEYLIDDILIGVEGGGTITFKNECGYAVPSEVIYQTKEVAV